MLVCSCKNVGLLSGLPFQHCSIIMSNLWTHVTCYNNITQYNLYYERSDMVRTSFTDHVWPFFYSDEGSDTAAETSVFWKFLVSEFWDIFYSTFTVRLWWTLLASINNVFTNTYTSSTIASLQSLYILGYLNVKFAMQLQASMQSND